MARRISLPDLDEPIDELLDRRERYAARRAKRRKAEKWIPVHLSEAAPFGIAFFGDMHIDDNDCAIRELRRDLKTVASTPGMYGVHLGDATNNWVGRLAMKLSPEQSATQSEARRLASWVLRDVGVDWIAWLLGNHDEWNEGDAILSLLADGAVHLFSWEGRFEIRAAGQSWRVHAAHDFAGSSIFNPVHGPMRKALRSGGSADLYVCGHKHHLGYGVLEIEERGTLAHSVRATGYKGHDHHAVVNGHPIAESGRSVVAIFNPAARTKAGRIMVFLDVDTGAQALEGLRAAFFGKTKAPKARASRKPRSKPKAHRGNRK